MGEPAELTDSQRDDVRRWARFLIECVRIDGNVTWQFVLGCDGTNFDDALDVALVRAQVIDDGVSRSRLADALESEIFETDSPSDPLDRAKREGWNLATRSLVARLREGFTP